MENVTIGFIGIGAGIVLLLLRVQIGVALGLVSFIGIAGLGYQIQLSLDDLLYGQVWTLLLFLIAIVATIDLWSSIVRSRLIS